MLISWYIYNEYGDRVWYVMPDVIHREDGPAVEWEDGTKGWYLNGKPHREDGPAVEWEDGTKEWYVIGVRHREDGPAIEYLYGDKRWFLNGMYFTEEKFLKKTKEVSC